VYAGRLDPQQILEGQRIAALFQRQHHFTDAEILDEARKIVNRGTGDGFLDDGSRVGHRNVADDDKARFGPLAQITQPLRAVSGAKHHHPPTKGGGAKHAAQHHAIDDEEDNAERHRIGERGAPEVLAAGQKVDERQRNDTQRDRDQQPRHGEAHRPQGIGTVDSDRDHRDRDHHCETRL